MLILINFSSYKFVLIYLHNLFCSGCITWLSPCLVLPVSVPCRRFFFRFARI